MRVVGRVPVKGTAEEAQIHQPRLLSSRTLPPASINFKYNGRL